jgi:predicted 3-demethylubiquinone-9 3-methyltransferase (glyoxalase superfamily)
MTSITPFLWFDADAEEAAELYVSLFPNSSITRVDRYPEGSPMPAGSAMSVFFELDGRPVHALNGGAMFPHTEAFSFFVEVDSQEEVDRYWEALLAGGGTPSQCGWLKDRFGLSWQIVPSALGRLMSDPDPERASRVMQAMLGMQKLVVADLEAAAAAA